MDEQRVEQKVEQKVEEKKMNNRIFYHARKSNELIVCEHCGEETRLYKGLNPPIFTIGFEYDSNKKLLFIAWAKPINGESYSKTFGIRTVNNRLDRIIKHFPNLSYINTPIVVNKYVNFYINKARKYFKEMPIEIDYFI